LTGWRSRRTGIAGALLVGVLVLVGSLTLRGNPASAQASPSPSTGVAAGTTAPSIPPRSPSPSSPAASLPPTAWSFTPVAASLADIAITARGYIVIGDDRRGGVVWSSTNGQDWQVDDDSVIFDRVHLEAIASNSHLTAIVGCDHPGSDCEKPAAWIWNGAWHRVAGNPFGATTLVDVVATSAAIVVRGTAADESQHLWSSVDGTTWSALAVPGARGDTVAAIAAAGDRLIAVGRAADGYGQAWVSTDLRSWAAHRIAFAARPLSAVGFHGTFVVGGGSVIQEAGANDGEIDDPALWTSTDGATWTSTALVSDNNGAITMIAATARGTIAMRPDCCGGYFIPPTGPAMHLDEGPGGVTTIVDAPEGFIGTGSSGFATSPAVAISPPLDPTATTVSNDGDGWTTMASVPVPNPLTTAADAKGRAYVFSPTVDSGTLRVDRFDGQKWLRLPDVAGDIRDARAVLGTKGLIYLVGVGLDGKLGRTIEYNPGTHTWRARAAMPTARTGFGLAAPGNGSIYVFGGRVSPCCDAVHGDGALAIVERFDPATNSWHRVRSMPVADASPGAVAASAPVPAGSEEGRASPTGTNPIVYVFLPAREWAYDPAKDTWTAGPAGLSYGVTGSPVVGADGIVRVFNCDRYDMYDPFNNHWQTGQFFPSPRCGALAVAGIDAQIYVFGGDYLPSPGRSVLAFFAGGG
jgi:hypothetical protein